MLNRTNRRDTIFQNPEEFRYTESNACDETWVESIVRNTIFNPRCAHAVALKNNQLTFKVRDCIFLLFSLRRFVRVLPSRDGL